MSDYGQGYDPYGMQNYMGGGNGQGSGWGQGGSEGGQGNEIQQLLQHLFGGGSGGFGGGLGGMLGGGLGSMLGGMFGGNGADQYKKSMQYNGQIPGQVAPYLQPYMQAGQGAMGNLQGQYGNLLQNPGGVVNQIGKSFHQSPGYQFQVNQATDAANRAGAAGGYTGSPQEQVQLAGTVNGLANQDYYNYLGNAMGAYGQGLQGEQGLMQQGFGANEDMAGMIQQMLQNQASAAAAAGANKQEGGGLGGLLGGLAGSFFL